ncbi:HTH domain-containing protein [Rouxiella chamberiensis]|uniref:HTH domain-containing protein n=1 Tax=Rouxiella chamberiensis TaxID=1513468 RepID=A0ABY7HRR5_9GAMM|nr:HTH domain-containing protein [Rouxiella chamberiensis]WAT01764.1 HTH domain-containing protein [Rouxiella chamberiensis]
MTIIEAIVNVLKEYGKPLSHKDIYDCIINKEYYSFGAKDPVAIVRGKLENIVLALISRVHHHGKYLLRLNL